MGSSPEIHGAGGGWRSDDSPLGGGNASSRGKCRGGPQSWPPSCWRTKGAGEHVMLVDLARNDLGRVSDYGTCALAM